MGDGAVVVDIDVVVGAVDDAEDVAVGGVGVGVGVGVDASVPSLLSGLGLEEHFPCSTSSRSKSSSASPMAAFSPSFHLMRFASFTSSGQLGSPVGMCFRWRVPCFLAMESLFLPVPKAASCSCTTVFHSSDPMGRILSIT